MVVFQFSTKNSAFGSSHLGSAVVAPLASINMKRLELGYVQAKPVPKEALDVLCEHYGPLEFTVGQRHFMTAAGTWVKIYLSQADGAVEVN